LTDVGSPPPPSLITTPVMRPVVGVTRTCVAARIKSPTHIEFAMIASTTAVVLLMVL
jgi:hypothetical protein